MKQLDGKRCLIVGGASGIGLAAARRFLREGALVAIADRAAAPVGEIPFFSADVTDAEQVSGLFRNAIHELGGLDVLYHVAGISGRKLGDGPLHQCSDDGWQTVINANLTSVFLTNREAVRHFLAAKQPGAILNMASVLAFSPSPQYFDTAAYAASKGGIIALSRYSASRYAADKIRVNVIAPGLIDTPMAQRAVNDPAIRAFLATKQPLAGGPGSAEDCVGAAVFLCGPDSALVTGTVLPVDAGWCVSEEERTTESQRAQR